MITLAVHVIPKSSENRILGWTEESQGRRELAVRLTSPPVDGKANEALVKLLARTLGIPKSSIQFKSGQNSRHKLLALDMEQSQFDTLLQQFT